MARADESPPPANLPSKVDVWIGTGRTMLPGTKLQVLFVVCCVPSESSPSLMLVRVRCNQLRLLCVWAICTRRMLSPSLSASVLACRVDVA